jgi:hypothetical protein
MLTIISWIVFVPAVLWNVSFFAAAFVVFMDDKQLFTWRNFRDCVISLAMLFVPGIYLFGVF